MNVRIYGKKNCVYCTMAKELCEEKLFPYTYLDVGIPDNLKELKLRCPTAKTVPQIYIGERYIGGFNEFEKYVADHQDLWDNF